MIKLDIINRVADKTGGPKMKAEQAVEALFHSMKEALTRGERIELRGFGVFVVKPRKRGVGRNPRTGEEVAIPSGKTIRFKVTVDGKPPAGDHGMDVDANGNGVVKDQRLYQLIRQSKGVASHTFTIEFLDPGVQAYSFTFG